jgi:hypothetical protein
MKKLLVMTLVNLRWVYFHINPNYIKFSIEGTEFHFQHKKTGHIYCNYTWND